MITTDPTIYLEDKGWMCLDVETTSEEFGSALVPTNRLLLSSWYTPEEGMQTHVGGENDSRPLIEAVKKATFIIAHNAKFELHWLARCGVDLTDLLVYDTMLGEWVIAGNRQISKSLDATAERYGVGSKEHEVSKLIQLGVCPENIPTEWLSSYCEQDVRITTAIFLKQREVLRKREQLHLQLARCLVTPVLADMETNGVTLDKDRVKEEYDSVVAQYADTERDLHLLAEKHELADINWRSRPQVADFLYNKLGFSELKDRRGTVRKTPGGAPLTDQTSIGQLRANTADQRKFKELYGRLSYLNARLTKSLNFFKTICDEHDGTFFGIFNQGQTGTHRLSSSGRKVRSKEGGEYSAQLQNLPREYKRLFRARQEGWRILEIDASQLEFRVAADLGGDEVAKREIEEGADIHSNTAKVYVEDGTLPEFAGLTVKEARQPAKAKTFAPLYGATGQTEADKKYVEFFRKKYNQLFSTQTGWTHEVLRNKKLRTPYGMEFYWPNTTMSKSGYINNSTAIFNYPVQGLATAEIIPAVLVHVWKKLRGWDVKLVLTIHDSLVMEVGPDVDVDKLNDLLFECFTTDAYDFLDKCYGYRMTVPLGAESKIGEWWGEGEEIKYTKAPEWAS